MLPQSTPFRRRRPSTKKSFDQNTCLIQDVRPKTRSTHDLVRLDGSPTMVSWSKKRLTPARPLGAGARAELGKHSTEARPQDDDNDEPCTPGYTRPAGNVTSGILPLRNEPFVRWRRHWGIAFAQWTIRREGVRWGVVRETGKEKTGSGSGRMAGHQRSRTAGCMRRVHGAAQLCVLSPAIFLLSGHVLPKRGEKTKAQHAEAKEADAADAADAKG